MARGSVIKRCAVCRREGRNQYTACNHPERMYGIFYRVGRKPVFKTVGPNKKDAERRLGEVMRDINQGTYCDLKAIAFEEFSKKWLETYAAMSVKPSTLRNYGDAVRCHFIPAFGHMPLARIHETDIRGFIAKTLKNRKPKTVNNFLIMLKTMFKHAKRWGYVRENPAWDIEHVRDDHQEMDFITPEEVRLLIKHADEPCRTVIQLAVMTGMRRGEIFGMQWGDIDWFNNTIHVRRNLYWHSKRAMIGREDEPLWCFLSPKTKRSARSVVMSPALRKILEIHRITAPVGVHDLVFCNKMGNPIDPNNFIQREFHPTLTRAALRKIRFHDLRHTYATFLIAQNENIKFIQSQLGHASIQTTIDRYGHILPNTHHGVGERLDKQVFGGIDSSNPIYTTL
jgi:integrase